VKYQVRNGANAVQNVCTPNNGGSVSSIDLLEDQYPGYLHSLYRYTTKLIRVKSSFAAIAIGMNMKSRSPGETRPSTNLSRRQVNDWFTANSGKEYSLVEKLLDNALVVHMNPSVRTLLLYQRLYLDIPSKVYIPWSSC